MSLIRPEAQAALWRWREVILGLGVVLLALWWGTTAFGFLRWVAGALGMAGGMLMIVGAQRGRFRLGADGFGVVQVIEGQIRYFGPVMGGAISMSELDFIELDHRQAPPFWVLSQPGMDAVKIPIDTKGAEALFDAFSALPELRTDFMLSQLQGQSRDRVVIWQRSSRALNCRLED